MAYNNANSSQYSPYYLPHQSGLPQQPGLAQPHGSGSSQQFHPKGSDTHSTTSHPPLGAYQSDFQHSQNQQDQQNQASIGHASSNSYGTTSFGGNEPNSLPNYGRMESATTSEANYGSSYSTTRSDTSALGSLAYASSLGQESQNQSNLSQAVAMNRYHGNNPYQSQAGNHGEDNGARGYTGLPQVSQPPPASAAHPFTNVQTVQAPSYSMKSAGRSSPAQYQYNNPPASSSAIYSQAQTSSHPPRPASGQSLQRPNSRTAVQYNQSPQLANRSGATGKRQYNKTHQVRTSSPAMDAPAGRSVTQPSGQASPGSRNNHNIPSGPTSSMSHDANTGHVQQQEYQIQPPAGPNSQVTGQPSPRNPPLEPEIPTNVNPSLVFDHQEYQRRQTEQEKAKREYEAAKALSAANATAVSSPPDDVTQAAKALMKQSGPPGSDAARDQIEQEMKAMIEKMRDYKARDPGLFSQVWEELKKGTPAQSGPSKPPNASTVSSPQIDVEPAKPPQIDLPAVSDLVTGPSQELDRGKYPMYRRRRGNASYTPDKTLHSKKKKQQSGTERKENVPQMQPAQTEPPSALPPRCVFNSTQQDEPLPAGGPQFHQLGTWTTKPSTKGGRKPPPAWRSPPPESTAPAPNAPPPIEAPPTAPSQAKFQAPQGVTHWPEDKKMDIAEAARSTLLADPANGSVSVTVSAIKKLLDGNPSYSQLCDHLEARGFRIDRGPFARQLLLSLPDLSSSQSAPPPVQPTYPANHDPPYKPPNGYTTPNYNAPYQGPLPPVPGSQAAFGPGYTGPGAPIKTESAPLTKEEKARKRMFADIVDLTTISDGEAEFLRHRPRPRPEPPKPPRSDQPPQSPEGPWGSTTDRAQTQKGRPGPSTTDQLHPKLQPVQPILANSRNHLLYDTVAESLNGRRDALRKSSYEPRTIARDILLACGRHPSLQPLNHHLDTLRDRFNSVDQNTDLTTFRWDLVDPGGEPGPVPTSQTRQTEDDGERIQDAASPVEAAVLARSRAFPSFKVSANPKLTSHPQKVKDGIPKRRGRPPKNPKPSSIQPLGDDEPRGDPSAVLQTPMNQSPSYSSFNPVNQSAPSDPPASSAIPPGQHDRIFSHFSTPVLNPQLGLEPSSATSSSASEAKPPKVPGRKGRPPGSKNKAPRATPQNRKDQAHIKRSRSPNSPMSIPSHVKRDPSTPVSVASHRQSGLRHVMTPSSSGIAIVVPSRSPSVAESGSAIAKRRGPIKQEEDISRKHPLSSPTPPSYTCRWQDCSRNFGALDTLRDHVRRAHRGMPSEHGLRECRWADCFDPHSSHSSNGEGTGEGSSDSDDAVRQRQRLTFKKTKRWDDHVEWKHLRPYSYEVGDETTGFGVDPDPTSSPYLSDASGNRVTPRSSQASRRRVRGSMDAYRYRPDPLPFNTDPNVIDEYHEAHDNETDKSQRKAMVRALTSKKKRVGGMGIYKTGTRGVGTRKRVSLTRTEEVERLGVGHPVVQATGKVWLDQSISHWISEREGDGGSNESGGSEEDFGRV